MADDHGYVEIHGVGGIGAVFTITICVGSSCTVRGAERLAGTLEDLIVRERLVGRVELVGAFCMEQCSMGVSVRVGDRVYAGVDPEEAGAFFYETIVPLLEAAG